MKLQEDARGENTKLLSAELAPSAHRAQRRGCTGNLDWVPRFLKAGVVDLLNPQGNTSVVVSDQLPHGCRC